jgi:peptide/bleomycin uptake transporter
MTVALNTWYGGFYNLLQKATTFKANPDEGITLFFAKLFALSPEKMFHVFVFGAADSPSFAEIAFPYVLLATITAYFTRRYGLWWREAITFHYAEKWRKVKVDIEGASQRIQEDASRFARIVESLGLQVVRATLTLVAFLPLLWYLSQFIEFDMPYFGSESITFIDTQSIIDASQVDGVRFVQTPGGIQVTNKHYFAGLLVWAALIASVGGMIISWFVGWKLPGLEFNNQVKEAAFRKELVYGEDNRSEYAHIPTLTELFFGVRSNYKRLFMHYGYFDIWLNMYDQFMVIVPYLMVGPSLFTGAVLLGVVVQVSNAFSRVHGSFALFIHNWTTITELRSVVKRLREFDKNLDKLQTA